jgi:nicotinamidase-related amidase
MPLTAVDPTPALVVVDLQVGIVAMPLPEMPTVLENSVRLAEAFRTHGWPVVLVNVEAAPGGRSDANPAGGARRLPEETLALAPELGAGTEGTVTITKHTRGAFHETSLEAELRARGVTQIFLTGVATGSGVEETGREGFARGLHVVTVTDAMADSDPEIHDFVVRKVFPKWSQTATTAEVLAAL